MVGDEIFGRGTDVGGVEVVVFVLHDVGFFFGKRCALGPLSLAEEVLPDFVCHLVRSDPERAGFAAIDVVYRYALGVNETCWTERGIPWRR
jgi:hypothetical protein